MNEKEKSGKYAKGFPFAFSFHFHCLVTNEYF